MNFWIAALLNSLGPACGMTVCVWAVLKFAPRVNAATRHAIWWVVLAVVVLLPAASVVIERTPRTGMAAPSSTRIERVAAPSLSGGSVVAPRVRTGRAAPIEVQDGGWTVILPLTWFAVLCFQLARIARSYRHVRGLKLRAAPANPALRQSFEAWMLATGVKRQPRVLVSAEVVSPMAVGFRHPAVILLESLPDHLRAGELDQVLLHELAHLARRDDWTNLLARLTAALVALHPVALWILRRIEREREHACDDWVVSHTGQARPYAESLARLFELCWTRRRVLLASGMAGRPSQLGGRIEALLRSRHEVSAKASLVKVAVSVAALVVFGLAAAGLPRWIAFARTPQPAPRIEQQASPGAPAKSKRPTGTPAPAAPSAAAALPQKSAGTLNPAAPQGGFLAALVAAGYGDLSVDEIIALKNAGVSPEFLREMSRSGWGKLPSRDLMDLRSHGVSPDYAASLLDAGIADLSIARVIELHSQGVRAEFVDAVHALGFGPFEARQLIDMHNHGVRGELLRALKDAGFQGAVPREIIEAASAGLRESDLREARQFGSSLTLRQIIKLKHSGVLR
jgi:bla regulator protein blaR1